MQEYVGPILKPQTDNLIKQKINITFVNFIHEPLPLWRIYKGITASKERKILRWIIELKCFLKLWYVKQPQCTKREVYPYICSWN